MLKKCLLTSIDNFGIINISIPAIEILRNESIYAVVLELPSRYPKCPQDECRLVEMSGAILIDTFSITIKSVLKDSEVDKNLSFKVLRFRKEQKMKTFIVPVFFLSFFYLADGEYDH